MSDLRWRVTFYDRRKNVGSMLYATEAIARERRRAWLKDGFGSIVQSGDWAAIVEEYDGDETEDNPVLKSLLSDLQPAEPGDRADEWATTALGTVVEAMPKGISPHAARELGRVWSSGWLAGRRDALDWVRYEGASVLAALVDARVAAAVAAVRADTAVTARAHQWDGRRLTCTCRKWDGAGMFVDHVIAMLELRS